MPSIVDHAKGKWKGILSTFGVDSRFLTGKHGPCPMCGGKDRWRWDNKDGRGSWICSHDGAGDGFALLMRIKGWEFAEAAKEVEKIIGTVKAEQAKPQQTDSQKRAAMNRLWRSSAPLSLDEPAGKYLHTRIGLTEFPPCLRSARDYPMMVAMVSDPKGCPSILHRTYLTRDGCKSTIESPRRLMPGTVAKGSAVRLAEFTDELGIAEGIETALSASVLFRIPCWAALTEGLLASWQWPEGVKRLVVFGDNDRNYVGQSAAYVLARRIALSSDKIEVAVKIPSEVGEDWDDVRRKTTLSVIAA